MNYSSGFIEPRFDEPRTIVHELAELVRELPAIDHELVEPQPELFRRGSLTGSIELNPWLNGWFNPEPFDP